MRKHWPLILLALVAFLALFLFAYGLLDDHQSMSKADAACLDCVRAHIEYQITPANCDALCKIDAEVATHVPWDPWPRVLLLILVILVALAPLGSLWWMHHRHLKVLSEAEQRRDAVKKDAAKKASAGERSLAEGTSRELAEAEERLRFAKEALSDFFVTVAIHFLPYTILAMAMLFEYHYVKEGGGHGAAAVASIMILFILAELGALMLSTVMSVREEAEAIQENAKILKDGVLYASDAIRGEIRSIRIMRHYAALMAPFAEDSTEAAERGSPRDGDRGPSEAFERLVESWGALATISAPKCSGKLLRVLLSRYFEEECKDISGAVERSDVPSEVWPLSSEDRLSGKVAFVATNVGFYASFLGAAVRELRQQSVSSDAHRPCVATVTNVLPSMWWNWMEQRGPQSQSFRFLFEPIQRYRQELERVATGQMAGRVFRTVLVAKDGFRGPLRTTQEWEVERGLVFQVDGDASPVLDQAGRPPAVRWDTLAENYEYLPDLDRERASYRILSGRNPWRFQESNGRLGLFHDGQESDLAEDVRRCRLVLDVYAQAMHPGDRGYTEILSCNANSFAAFDARPDLTFLGACADDDIWSAQDGAYEWHLATLATMDTRTRTMFLTVVHDRTIIAELWRRTKQARTTVSAAGKSMLAKTHNGSWVHV